MELLTAQYIPLTVVRARAVLDGRPGWSHLLHIINPLSVVREMAAKDAFDRRARDGRPGRPPIDFSLSHDIG